jgi:hypothetical protein
MEVLQDPGDIAEITKKLLASLCGIFTLASAIIFTVPEHQMDSAAPLFNSLTWCLPAANLETEEYRVGIGCGGVGLLTLFVTLILDVTERYARRKALERERRIAFDKLSLKGEFDKIIKGRVRKYSEQEGEWFFCERKSVFEEINAKLNDHFAIQLVADP